MFEQSSISSNVSVELCSDSRCVISRSSTSSSAVSGELFDSSEELSQNSELPDDISKVHSTTGTLDNDTSISCFDSDHAMIQDSMTESTGPRNTDVVSCVTYYDLDSNKTAATSSLLQQNYDSMDSLQYEELDRQIKYTNLACSDLPSNPGGMNYSDPMYDFTKIAASNIQPEVFTPTCYEYLPNEYGNNCKPGRNENSSESSSYSKNGSETESLDIKCNNQSEKITEPENNGLDTTDNLFDVISSYVAMLGSNNNDLFIPETIPDGQNEVVEIYVFDDVDNADGKSVDGLKGANDNCGEIDSRMNKCEETMHTAVRSEKCIDSVQEEFIEGDNLLVHKNTTNMNVESKNLNLVSEDRNVYLPSTGMCDWVDFRPDRCEGGIDKLYDNSIECDVPLKECNTSLDWLNSTKNVADYQYRHENYDRFLDANNNPNNDQHNPTNCFDTPGQMDTLCSGQNLEIMTKSHSQNTVGQPNDMKVCASTSSQGKRPSNSDLKTSNSLVKSKKPARTRKRKGKEICVKLPDNLIDRDLMLHRLKIGKFGKRPHVVRITQNGTLLDVTQEYLLYLPCRIKH